MRIVIIVEERHPPAGQVVVDSGPGCAEAEQILPFTGWLGLMAVLSAIVESPPAQNCCR